jgi:DNA-binding SARP family transcriptional activator
VPPTTIPDLAGHRVGPDRPLLICLLGTFRVLRRDRELPLRGGGKVVRLLSMLALGDQHRVSRQTLLGALWPDSDESRGAHALASMVHGLHDGWGEALDGAPPVLHRTGAYQLNIDAGVGVDTDHFEALVRIADGVASVGDRGDTVQALTTAVDFYRGDLYTNDDLRSVIERERLRSVHLSLLSRLADLHFQESRYRAALYYASRLLAQDPCREDAHRMVMRCHVRLAERAQALRQYVTCRQVLAAEFDAEPEPLTVLLHERIRLDPGAV